MFSRYQYQYSKITYFWYRNPYNFSTRPSPISDTILTHETFWITLFRWCLKVKQRIPAALYIPQRPRVYAIDIFILGIKQKYLDDNLVGSKVKLPNAAAHVVDFQVFNSAAKILFVRHNIFKTSLESTTSDIL